MKRAIDRRFRRESIIGAGALAVLMAIVSLWPSLALAQPDDLDRCESMGKDLVVGDGERLDCDVSVVGADFTVEPAGYVRGDIGIFSGDAKIGGTVEGDLAVAWGNAEISGEAQGDVFVSGDLTLRSGAKVSGDVTVFGEIDREEGAVVEGGEWTLRNVGASGRQQPQSTARWLMPLVFALVTVGLASLFAALAVGVIPGTVALTRDATGTLGGIVLSTFIGSIALLVLPILLIVTLITVIGPLVVLAAYGVGTALGSVGAGEIIGRRFASRSSRPTRAAIGAGAIAAAITIPLYFGTEMGLGGLYCGSALAAWCAVSWSLGASVRAFIARRAGSVNRAVPEAPPDPRSLAEIPADIVERADEIVRSLGDDARRMEADYVSRAVDMPALPGMTPIYLALLRTEGIESMDELARSTVEQIEVALGLPGIRPVAKDLIQEWIDAARSA